MAEVSLSAWNDFLEDHPEAHLLQTGEWGELKRAFGWNPVRLVHGNRGVQILFRRLPLGLTMGYIPKGPVPPDGTSPFEPALQEELDSICARQRAVFCILEPDAWESTGLDSRSAWPIRSFNIQPRRTITVDLRGSEEDILARMKQKTRYNIGLAGKKGVSVHPWGDLDGFSRMMTITGGRDGFGVHQREYYRRAYDLFHPLGRCELLAATYQNQPLAALMVFARGRRAWYFYGASTDEERNRMPTYLLQWEAMRWARAHSCEVYDLWGVPDEEETTLEENFETRRDGLWGVYRFKRGFGGQLRCAARAVDRVYRPQLYRLYRWLMSRSESG